MPFIALNPDEVKRPFLPLTIINPATKRKINAYALIDTGADECALPSFIASAIGHDLQAGTPKKISTGNGISSAYSHTVRFQIGDFITDDVAIDFMPNLHMPLLGVKSFLSKFVLTIDYPAQCFSLMTL